MVLSDELVVRGLKEGSGEGRARSGVIPFRSCASRAQRLPECLGRTWAKHRYEVRKSPRGWCLAPASGKATRRMKLCEWPHPRPASHRRCGPEIAATRKRVPGTPIRLTSLGA